VTKEYSIQEQLKLGTTCALCNRKMSVDSPAYGVGGTFRSGVDLGDDEAIFVPVYSTSLDRVLPMFVVPIWSDAKADGKDIVYMTCSSKCAKHLETALEKDVESINLLIGSLLSSN